MPSTTSSTAPDQPDATIKVNTKASCADATPYLNWDITVAGGAPQSIVIHVLDSNGNEVLRLHESSGSVLWPGWTRVDNRMTLTNPAVTTLRLYADITLGSAAVLGRSRVMASGVVSTGQVTVTYPAASVECVGPPASDPTVLPTQVAPAAPAAAGAVADGAVAATPALPSQLPVTGFPSELAALAGLALILAGIVLVVRARAEGPATS